MIRLMHCEQAQRLFDAYLDGELSPTLATELGAHRLQCSDCRRALALLEVSEHILTLDQDPVSINAKFTDRLVACVHESRSAWRHRLGRFLYVGGPIAAAAVIALAFLGVFDGRSGNEVAGDRVVVSIEDLVTMQSRGAPLGPQSNQLAEDQLLDRAQRSIEIKKRSVRSLQKVLDQTFQQPLNLLEESQLPGETPGTANEVSPSNAPSRSHGPPERADALEDL